MNRFFRNLSLAFASGAFGGLVGSVALWAAGKTGFNASLGVKLAPDFTPAWLYPAIVWGGVWGFLFLLPILRYSVFWRALLWSLIPTIFQLFYVYPILANNGWMGLKLGYFTPLIILFINFIWGFCTALWLFASGFIPDKTKEEHRWFSQKR